uniref:DNA-directed RNA polymerase III subunit RPC9 n=1 Tax=Heterorhabditis bacteriophora TaxID=37862 RepID=A0A1I7WDX9_HETBA
MFFGITTLKEKKNGDEETEVSQVNNTSKEKNLKPFIFYNRNLLLINLKYFPSYVLNAIVNSSDAERSQFVDFMNKFYSGQIPKAENRLDMISKLEMKWSEYPLIKAMRVILESLPKSNSDKMIEETIDKLLAVIKECNSNKGN